MKKTINDDLNYGEIKYPKRLALDILALRNILKSANKKIIVAIDGRCGAGKTTMATNLKELLNCSVIATDDFFLPPDLRTESRFNEPGGNIHYERFENEVINELKSNESFKYGVFDCESMMLSHTEFVSPKDITIIEGAYSLHPRFIDIYDLKIFCDIAPSLQKERIINRNGFEQYRDFESKWIPMEEKYFKMLDIESKCDYVIK